VLDDNSMFRTMTRSAARYLSNKPVVLSVQVKCKAAKEGKTAGNDATCFAPASCEHKQLLKTLATVAVHFRFPKQYEA